MRDNPKSLLTLTSATRLIVPMPKPVLSDGKQEPREEQWATPWDQEEGLPPPIRKGPTSSSDPPRNAATSPFSDRNRRGWLGSQRSHQDQGERRGKERPRGSPTKRSSVSRGGASGETVRSERGDDRREESKRAARAHRTAAIADLEAGMASSSFSISSPFSSYNYCFPLCKLNGPFCGPINYLRKKTCHNNNTRALQDSNPRPMAQEPNGLPSEKDNTNFYALSIRIELKTTTSMNLISSHCLLFPWIHLLFYVLVASPFNLFPVTPVGNIIVLPCFLAGSRVQKARDPEKKQQLCSCF